MNVVCFAHCNQKSRPNSNGVRYWSASCRSSGHERRAVVIVAFPPKLPRGVYSPGLSGRRE
jgi:hypothetical protein